MCSTSYMTLKRESVLQIENGVKALMNLTFERLC